MAVTITYKASQNTNKSWTSNSARGVKFATGELNFSGLTYPTSGGVTTDFTGFGSVWMVTINPEDGLFFEYDLTNEAIIVRVPGTATNTSTLAAGETLMQEVSNVTLSSWNAVRFWAVGR